MQNKFQQSVTSGIIATVGMTVLMVIGGAMGMPKMSPPEMLAGMMKVPVAAGWVMHFMIGIIFAAGYVLFFNDWLKKISSKLLKGVIYGIIAFIVGQISIAILSAIFGDTGMPQPQGSAVLMMIGSVMGHLVFGIIVAMVVKPVTPVTKQILK